MSAILGVLHQDSHPLLPLWAQRGFPFTLGVTLSIPSSRLLAILAALAITEQFSRCGHCSKCFHTLLHCHCTITPAYGGGAHKQVQKYRVTRPSFTASNGAKDSS